MKESVHISVVSPVYGCAAALEELYARLKKTLSKISDDFEIILVNDASPDKAWETIEALAKKDARVKGINLSRNFGQHRAITAGLDYVRGEWVVVMDCDLQDQPEEIVKFYEETNKGFDIVTGKRLRRKSTLFEKVTSYLFHNVFRYLSGINHDPSVASFGIYSRSVIESAKRYKEHDRTFGMIINLLGFKKTAIPIEHAKRPHGKSAYNFMKRMNLAIESIVAHSNKPLHLSIRFGFLLSLLSLGVAVWLIIRYFLQDITVAGWTSVIVSIFFIGGLLLINLGVLGLYIGKIFNEAKGRPLYVVRETTFDKSAMAGSAHVHTNGF